MLPEIDNQSKREVFFREQRRSLLDYGFNHKRLATLEGRIARVNKRFRWMDKLGASPLRNWLIDEVSTFLFEDAVSAVRTERQQKLLTGLEGEAQDLISLFKKQNR